MISSNIFLLYQILGIICSFPCNFLFYRIKHVFLLFRIILNKLTSIRNITQLQIGEDAIITEFANGFVACKLMSMGLLAGTGFTLVRKAPFGGAYYIKTKNHIIGLRADEAAYVLTKAS